MNDTAARNPCPERNARGFFVEGPQAVNPCDVLAKLMDEAKLAKADEHYAPAPEAERKQLVTNRGRQAYRRRYPTHGPAEFVYALTTTAA